MLRILGVCIVQILRIGTKNNYSLVEIVTDLKCCMLLRGTETSNISGRPRSEELLNHFSFQDIQKTSACTSLRILIVNLETKFLKDSSLELKDLFR